MKNSITIKNSSPMVAIIDIEGTIGVAEELQFSTDQQKVATYQGFKEKLDEIRELECEHIRVNIRSCGGDLNDALLIYQALCENPSTVETHCYGYVASAATVIAQAASQGERYVSSGSLYLIHNASMTVEGNQNEALRTAELLQKSDDQIAQLYAERSGLPKDGFRELMSSEDGKGRWLTPEEAVGFALADQIEKPDPLSKIKRKVQNLLSSFTDKSQVASKRNAERSPDSQPQISASGDYFISTDTLGRRANIYPTRTEPIEDPVIHVEGLTAIGGRNVSAYTQDLVNFL